MNVSSWSIKNPIPAIMLFVLLTLVGLYSFKAMNIQLFPDIELPMVTVTTTLPGAAPNQLENEVARKLEDSLTSMQGLKHMYTRIGDGVVTITCEFRIEKPIQEALDDVRSNVSRARGSLPQNVNEPIINKVDMASSPVLAYTIASTRMDAQGLSWFVDNDVTKLLLSVKGVGSINRVGGVERQITVALDPLRLQALNASAGDVSRQINNIQIERAGGKAEIGNSEQPLRTMSTLKSAQELMNMELALSDGRRIRLSQVADVSDSFAKPKAAAFLDGKPVVGFEVVRSKSASDLDVGAGVREKLAALRVARPDVKITESFDFITKVSDDYTASMHMLLEGALLAVLVVWLFLRDGRATLVSALALPLSAIPAFIGMYYLNFSINTVTLLAMSLVIGILVDDAIVEVENIVRHMRMGKTPYQAAMEAADEIGLAVIATTFTLIAVFLPTAFMTGIVGKFFKQFGWTASFAIFASLMVARMLTPMMAAYMMKPIISGVPAPAWMQKLAPARAFWNWSHTHPDEPAWLTKYMGWVEWCIHNRWKVSITTLVLVVASLFQALFIPGGFIPPDDGSQTQVQLELAPGVTLQETEAAAEQARVLLMQVPHVKSIYTTIGSGKAGSDAFNPASTEVRKAALTIQLDQRGQRPRKQVIEKQMRDVLTQIPGVRSKVGLGGSGEKYQIAVIGTDVDALQSTALKLTEQLRGIKGLGNIESSAALSRTEVLILPDLAKMAERGVTSAAIADTLRVATAGDYDNMLSKLNLSQRQIPIVVSLNKSGLDDLATLERLTVVGSKGPVMIGQVATLQFGSGPSVIQRYDRERNIQFNVELAGIPLGDATKAISELPIMKSMPPGVRAQAVGDAEANAEMAQGFAMAMITGVLCIYVVLVLLFKAFLHPFTSLSALLFSVTGALFALLVTQKMLSMPALIGLLMLMGVSSKNSILLIDYAIEARRKHGMERVAALLDACHKRARPILMTSIAMAAGMLPIAIGLGEADTSFRAPMAVAVIGGLTTSTLLSLLVLPAVFTIVDDAPAALKWLLRKIASLVRKPA